jgi:hypothetical protein
MPLGWEEQAALERQKQNTRDEILDDGIKTVHDQFDPFLPKGVEKIRIVPGEEAENIREWATLAAREKRYAEKRIAQYVRDHRLTKVFIRDRDRQPVSIQSDIGSDLLRYALRDDQGFYYYLEERGGRPHRLPEYLGADITPVTDEISGRLAIMSASKNEEMITNTLEKPQPLPYPTYPPAQRASALPEDDGR